MEITTIVGLVLALALIVVGIFMGGGAIGSFIDASSLMITVGGTFAAMFIAYSLKDVTGLGKVVGTAFKSSNYDPIEGINAIVGLANIARKEGMLALEENVNQLEEPFLQKGIMLIVDGTDPELVKSIMEAEISSLESRHSKGAGMMEQVGALAPAFGMLGTLVGLIIMLGDMSDPDSLGSGMSAALITTFYGSLIANAIALPLANKLKVISSSEVMYKEILLEGILSIQAGENPRIIEEKLYSFLPRSAKESASSGEASKGDGNE